MTEALPAQRVAAQIATVFKDEHGRVMATLLSRYRDFELAEDAIQDALLVALERWPSAGIPDNPGAWITTSARRKLIDRLRRDKKLSDDPDELDRMPAPSHEQVLDEDAPASGDIYPDERLKLMFVCCHPALSVDARVALTLKTLGGLSTDEIAHTFLIPSATLAQRLVRAQRKIRVAGIGFSIPSARQLPERSASVLAVLYLIFNAGYSAAFGDTLIRGALCVEAIRLSRLLCNLLEAGRADPVLSLYRGEAAGLLALMLLIHARRDARVGADGGPVLLEAQDRSLWHTAEIAEGLQLLEAGFRAGPPGAYLIQASINALHCEAGRFEDTDWPQIALLYQRLNDIAPTPVAQLNWAAAVSYADGPEQGLALIERLGLAAALERYHLLHAARADMLRRLGHMDDARAAYAMALNLSRNEVERQFLRGRLEALEHAITSS